MTPAWMVVGATFAPTTFAGRMLVPVPPALILGFATDPNGSISISGISGGGGPLTFYLQCLYADGAQPRGFGFSNALQVDLLP